MLRSRHFSKNTRTDKNRDVHVDRNALPFFESASYIKKCPTRLSIYNLTLRYQHLARKCYSGYSEISCRVITQRFSSQKYSVTQFTLRGENERPVTDQAEYQIQTNIKQTESPV